MPKEPASNATPPSFPPDWAESPTGGTAWGDEQSFNWEALVPHAIHPIKVAIIEALAWVGQPLSSSQLVSLFDDPGYYISLISFHAKGLAKWGAIEIVETRQVRGSRERFFFFSDGSGLAATPDPVQAVDGSQAPAAGT